MRQLVTPQVTVATEHLAALVALIGLVVGVGEQVGLEVAALVEGALADGALVRALLHVEDPMHGQRPRLAEALPTLGAAEWLLLRVDVAVVPQVVLPPERLAAHVTREGTLVRVRALMDEQVVGLGELAVTKFADKLLARTAGGPT